MKLPMKCDAIDELLLAGDSESLERAAAHALGCAACAESLSSWNEIGEAARSLRTSWNSDLLWRRVERRLRSEQRGGIWRVAAAVALTCGLGVAGWRLTVRDSDQETFQRTVARQDVVAAVESAEQTYVRAIGDLEKLAAPKLDLSAPLMISYREKLMLLDDAIAECENAIEENRNDAYVRRQLLAVYGEKQRTLQDVLREGSNVANQ